MNKRILGTLLLAASPLVIGIAKPALADSMDPAFIDFEDATTLFPPIGDNDPLTTEYQDAGFGFRFALDNNLNGIPDDEEGGDSPILEMSGDADPESGFLNDDLGITDTADAGFEDRLGGWFLRGGGLGQTTFPTLLIVYDTPTAEASGEVWDIDELPTGPPESVERWLVELLDDTDTVVDTILSPIGTPGTGPLEDPDSLDGRPWFFSFSRPDNDIFKIRIRFDDTVTDAKLPETTGLAFDNFSAFTIERPITVPEPSALLGLGLIAGSGWLLKNKRES